MFLVNNLNLLISHKSYEIVFYANIVHVIASKLILLSIVVRSL